MVVTVELPSRGENPVKWQQKSCHQEKVHGGVDEESGEVEMVRRRDGRLLDGEMEDCTVVIFLGRREDGQADNSGFQKAALTRSPYVRSLLGYLHEKGGA